MDHERPVSLTSFMNVKCWPFRGYSARLEVSSACEWSALEVDLTNSNHLRDDGGFENATSEAGFEAEASDESRRTGVGSGRIDFFASGGRIRSGCTGKRCVAAAELFTQSCDHARRRRN